MLTRCGDSDMIDVVKAPLNFSKAMIQHKVVAVLLAPRVKVENSNEVRTLLSGWLELGVVAC